jgi:hypothetical protein
MSAHTPSLRAAYGSNAWQRLLRLRFEIRDQTDDRTFNDRTNNQMLAELPGFVGDSGQRTISNVGADWATAT